MSKSKKAATAETEGRSSESVGTRMVEVGMLLWMLSITFLWWLLYGPGMTFITGRLGFLAVLGEWRASLLRFFTFTSWL